MPAAELERQFNPRVALPGFQRHLDDYRRLLAEVEELDAIRAYDAAKASGEAPIPFAQAVADLDHRPT